MLPPETRGLFKLGLMITNQMELTNLHILPINLLEIMIVLFGIDPNLIYEIIC